VLNPTATPEHPSRPDSARGVGNAIDVAAVFVFALVLVLGYLAPNAGSLANATPLPITHDEYANLLGADTFLQGRLSNPSSPVWQSFQSFHVLAQPTYASKYPPGNSAVLALGIRVAGSPIVGVWIAFALGCALLTWAAQPFVGRRWALVGGLGTALMMASTYWVYSYWGGALAFAGGAMLVGSTRRLWDHPAPWLGFALACGLAVLALTRPYEGLALSAPLVLALGWRVWSSRDRRPYFHAAVPAALTLTLLAAFLLHMNRTVTGSAFTFPYVEYDRQYAIPPALVFAAPRLPQEAPFREMKQLLSWANSPYAAQGTWGGWLEAVPDKLARFARSSFPKGLWLLFLALPFCLRDRWVRGLVALVAGTLAAVLAIVWVQPHYAAPVVAPVVILYLVAARRLTQVQWGASRIGWILVLLVGARWFSLGSEWYANALARAVPEQRPAWARVRTELQRQLAEEEPKRHVIIVRYAPQHNMHEDWVFNAANLESAPVLFARDLGAERNAALAEHFRERKIWLATVGTDPKALHLQTYAPE